MNVQRYKVGYYSDEWGVISNTPCLLKDDNGYAVKFEDYEQLRQRVQELEKERDSAYKIADHYRAERDELTKELATARLENTIKYGVSHPEMYKSEYEERLEKQRDELLAAAVMAVEMIEYNKHERRHVRWKLNDAIAAVRGAAEIGKEIGE